MLKDGEILMKKNKIYVKIFAIIVAIYVIITLANQQATLNRYEQESKELSTQIEEAKEYQTELADKKENISSLDFIEQMAREKLDMYYPNERVYIDRGM